MPLLFSGFTDNIWESLFHDGETGEFQLLLSFKVKGDVGQSHSWTQQIGQTYLLGRGMEQLIKMTKYQRNSK